MKIGEWQNDRPTESGMWLAKHPDKKDEDAFFVRVKAYEEGSHYYSPEDSSLLLSLWSIPWLWCKIHADEEEVDEIFPGTLEALGKISISTD